MHNFLFPVTMCIYINTEYWPEYSFNTIPMSVIHGSYWYSTLINNSFLNGKSFLQAFSLTPEGRRFTEAVL